MKLSDLEALCEKATPAGSDWERYPEFVSPLGYDTEHSYAVGPKHRESPTRDHIAQSRADQRFIIAARTELPKLLAALKIAREGLKFYDTAFACDINEDQIGITGHKVARDCLARIEEALK